ncbi:hypothetical protein C8D77_103391 [Mesorhizobium loti]|uniref:Uncharacterized protein n=1 Tax=Rhizobium loti TaxID=381 RepID=A0A8E2WFQ7_RHILI|nr:hypothetical protein C8D77_103391 [Mesorhizobium loti]
MQSQRTSRVEQSEHAGICDRLSGLGQALPLSSWIVRLVAGTTTRLRLSSSLATRPTRAIGLGSKVAGMLVVGTDIHDNAGLWGDRRHGYFPIALNDVGYSRSVAFDVRVVTVRIERIDRLHQAIGAVCIACCKRGGRGCMPVVCFTRGAYDVVIGARSPPQRALVRLWCGMLAKAPVNLSHNGPFAAGITIAMSAMPGVGTMGSGMGRWGPRRFANGAARFLFSYQPAIGRYVR